MDQCKVTMGTLEKQLEEEKQRVQTAESQRGAGTGNHELLFLQEEHTIMIEYIF